MSKHTPGPWRVDPSMSLCIDSPSGNVGLMNLARPKAESEANARIVAAAPDLLEALIELATEERRDDDDPVLEAARAKARAAIAKAEGRL